MKLCFDNRPLDGLDDIDLLGLKDKSNMITKTLISNLKTRGNNMIALYGSWGTGKTTLLYDVKKNIDREHKNVRCLVFNAWKYEQDDNLPLTLLDFLCDELSIDEKVSQGVINSANAIFKKTISLGLGIIAKKLSVESGDIDILKELIFDPMIQKNYGSLYIKEKEFKEEFLKLKEAITLKYDSVIIAIDDLDRCEPENLLNLLSAIKLFFTFDDSDENCITYICGVDKNAVESAINNKYGVMVNSEEYLEKVFDFSFSISETGSSFSIKGLIDVYISQLDIKGMFENYDEKLVKLEEAYSNLIEEYFNSIKMKNPRHIKKIVNSTIHFLNCMRSNACKDNNLKVNNFFIHPRIQIIIIHLIYLKLFRIDIYSSISNPITKLNTYRFNNNITLRGSNDRFDGEYLKGILKNTITNFELIDSSNNDDFTQSDNNQVNLNLKFGQMIISLLPSGYNNVFPIEFMSKNIESQTKVLEALDKLNNDNNTIHTDFLRLLVSTYPARGNIYTGKPLSNSKAYSEIIEIYKEIDSTYIIKTMDLIELIDFCL